MYGEEALKDRQCRNWFDEQRSGRPNEVHDQVNAIIESDRHVSAREIRLVTRQKLLRLDWEVMSHPPYSPDIAPSDYYLFRSLQYSLNDKTFNDDEAVKSHLVQFFADKDQKSYERGIMKFPETWQKVIEQTCVHKEIWRGNEPARITVLNPTPRTLAARSLSVARSGLQENTRNSPLFQISQ